MEEPTVKVEILNDGPGGWIEVRAPRPGQTPPYEVIRVLANATGPMSVVLSMIKEIEELREALELDAMELESAKDLVRHAKMRTEQDLDEVLRLLEDRGKPMMKETT